MPRVGPPRSPRRPRTAGQSRDGRMMNQASPVGQPVPPLARPVGGRLGRVEPEALPIPRLPVRASIYIAPDGTVHFGALFAELLPVAAALSTSPPTFPSPSPSPSPSTSTSPSPSTPTLDR